MKRKYIVMLAVIFFILMSFLTASFSTGVFQKLFEYISVFLAGIFVTKAADNKKQNDLDNNLEELSASLEALDKEIQDANADSVQIRIALNEHKKELDKMSIKERLKKLNE